MNKEVLALILAIIFYIAVIICFTVLAIITQKWWIILFALLFMKFDINFNSNNNDDEENKDDKC